MGPRALTGDDGVKLVVSVQAGEQLGPDWTLMKAGTEGCPEIPQWLAGNVAEPGRVGIDPYLHTVGPLPLSSTTASACHTSTGCPEYNMCQSCCGTCPARSGAGTVHNLQPC